MNRNIFIIIMVFFFSLLFAGCDAGPKIAPLDQDSVILAFGDSLTRGTGAAKEQSYPAVLGQMLGHNIINLGIPGEVTSRGLERLPAVLDEYNPSLVLLCHGGNDFLRRHNQDETIRNLRSMIGLIREKGADVILIGVPKLGFGLGCTKILRGHCRRQPDPVRGRHSARPAWRQ